MNQRIRNVRLIAEESDLRNWFDIYIDFSGSREYLMPHRRNTNIYNLLKDGIRIDDLERDSRKVISDISLSERRYNKGAVNLRLKCRKNKSRQLENSIEHLLIVVDEYLKDIACAI